MKTKLLLSSFSLITFISVIFNFSSQTLGFDVKAGPIQNNDEARKKCPAVCNNPEYPWSGNWKTTDPGKQSVCGCGWWLDKKGAVFKKINKAEQAKFDTFQNAIVRGKHPQDAAAEAGDTNYKRINGDRFQIRLSQKNRVTFLVKEDNKEVKILQVGGHL